MHKVDQVCEWIAAVKYKHVQVNVVEITNKSTCTVFTVNTTDGCCRSSQPLDT